MKTILLIMVGLFVLAVSPYAQSKKDSLLNELAKASSDVRPKLLRELCDITTLVDIEQAIAYGKQALAESQALKNDDQIMRAYLMLNKAYFNKGLADSIYIVSELAKNLAVQLKNDSALSKAYMGMGNGENFKGNYEKAIFYFIEGLKPAEKAKDTKQVYFLYNNLGVMCQRLGRRAEAENYYLKASEYLVNKKDPTPSEVVSLGHVYSNLSAISYISNRYDAAYEYAQKAVKCGKDTKNNRLLAYAYNELGNCYQKFEKYGEALNAYLEGYNCGKSSGDEYSMILVAAGAGTVFQVHGQLDSATHYLNESLALAKKFDDKNYLAEIYQLLTTLSAIKKDYKNHTLYDELARNYRDSTFNDKVAQSVSEAEVKYETEKKDRALIEQKAQNFRQRTWLIGLIISLLALVVFAYLYYNRYRLKQKTLLDAAIIKEQQLGLNAVIEAQETERKRIAKDLHDGIAQELVALKLGFNRLQNKIEKLSPDEAKNIAVLTNQLNDSCNEVRNMAHVMMPPSLETSGLVSALEVLLRNSLQHSNIHTEFEHFDLPERLNDKTEVGLYRIAQELLNNILKHAEASKVILQFYKTGNQLIMRFEDNGKGFDFEAAKQKSSMGLLNILSRVNNLGGTFFSEKAEPIGTISTIRIPIIV